MIRYAIYYPFGASVHVICDPPPPDPLEPWIHALRLTCPHCGCKTVDERTGKCVCGGDKHAPPKAVRVRR